MTTCCDLAAVLAQLQLENRQLQASISSKATGQQHRGSSQCGSSSSTEHLEKELQRVRSAHDQALQKRQQQVVQLEELAMQCQDAMQAAGSRQSAAQRTVGQLEAQLAATARRMQCASSMQACLQQAEQHHKQEPQDAEAQVQALREALTKAQQQLQQVKAKLIVSKTARAAARQALAEAEQQLEAGRQRRATLQHNLEQQCRVIAESWSQSAWDCIAQLCAAAPSSGCTADTRAAALAELWATAGAAGLQSMLDAGGGNDAVSCLSSLLAHFGCSSAQELVDTVSARLQAGASLRVVASAGCGCGAGAGAGDAGDGAE